MHSIILSTLTGTANFAQDRIPVDFRPYFVMAIGSLNIIAGIISTIQQFLKINELNEAHRVSAISWDKFYRNIKVEIAKSPSERLDVNHMLKICKEEFDRLMETSPTINNDIIKKFNITFKDNPAFKEVKKPEICDELISTDLFKFTGSLMNQLENNEEFQSLKRAKEDTENEYKKQLEMSQRNQHITQINLFKEQFKNVNNREPTNEEIIDNLKVLNLFFRDLKLIKENNDFNFIIFNKFESYYLKLLKKFKKINLSHIIKNIENTQNYINMNGYAKLMISGLFIEITKDFKNKHYSQFKIESWVSHN